MTDVPLTKWWESIALRFVRGHWFQDEDCHVHMKHWRGRFYIVAVERRCPRCGYSRPDTLPGPGVSWGCPECLCVW